jgi:hypothetical protein
MCSLLINMCCTNMTRQWIAGQKSKLLGSVGVTERKILRNVCDGVIDLDDLREKAPQWHWVMTHQFRPNYHSSS